MITGANTGLGYHAAEDFARRGAASIIFACRNLSRGQEAANKIKEATGNPNLHVYQLDLANLQSIKTFAQDVKEKVDKIDCLVCNAGVWFPMNLEAKTDDNLEMNVGVNHLGHFLLTNLLMGKVERVVIVSSGLMMSGKVDLDDSRQFMEGRRIREGDSVPKHAPVG